MAISIGYVGLGVMGMPFAGHLLAKAEHDVRVWDRDPAVRARASENGLTCAENLAEAIAHADMLFTCLPNPAAVEEVYRQVGKPGLLACDNSTVGPTQARELQSSLRQRGIGYVECPMLGGRGEAEAGSLFLIVSGEASDVERAVPVAMAAGREHRVVGGPGAASLFKTVQNGLGHIQATAIAEALALVAKAGGDIDRFIDVVGAGGGMAATSLFRAKAPMMRDPTIPPVGTLYIAEKDAGLAAALAREFDLDLPLFQRSAAVYRAAMEKGLGHEDMAAIARAVEDETDTKIAKS